MKAGRPSLALLIGRAIFSIQVRGKKTISTAEGAESAEMFFCFTAKFFIGLEISLKLL
jgi:hypothetical protein